MTYGLGQKTDKAVYWLGELGGFDDFGLPYGTRPGPIMYDARTAPGPWANMTPVSFDLHGGRIGQGLGQKYELQSDGRWLKIDG